MLHRAEPATDDIIEDQEFAESKASGDSSSANAGQQNKPKPFDDDDGFMNIPDGFGDELPFH